jgi:hypothetical protein
MDPDIRPTVPRTPSSKGGASARWSSRRATLLLGHIGILIMSSCKASAPTARTEVAQIRAWSASPSAGTAQGKCSIRKQNGKFTLSISATATCVTSLGLKVTVFDDNMTRLLDEESHNELLQPEPATTFSTGPFERTSAGYSFDVLLSASCAAGWQGRGLDAGSADGGGEIMAYGRFSCSY